MNTSISKNIKRLRQQAGLTQEQMAERLFVTRQTVSLWENGKTQPDIQTLERIAEVFNVDLMTVLYGVSFPKREEAQRKDALLHWGIITVALFLAFAVLRELTQELRLSHNEIVSTVSYAVRYLVMVIFFPASMLLCGLKISGFLNLKAGKRRLYKISMYGSIASLVILCLVRIMGLLIDRQTANLIVLDIIYLAGNIFEHQWLFFAWGLCIGLGLRWKSHSVGSRHNE